MKIGKQSEPLKDEKALCELELLRTSACATSNIPLDTCMPSVVTNQPQEPIAIFSGLTT